MKTFWFIRHGQSESNAGEKSTSPSNIPLTENGHKQAGLIADYIDQTPDLIVTSPYFRTEQTAKPTINKFPNAKHEVWNIQEYTYLPASAYLNTTTTERRPAAVAYFRERDPDLVAGEGGESYTQFIERIEKTLSLLKNSPHNHTLLFGHGWFIRGILLNLLVNPEIPKRNRKLNFTTMQNNILSARFPLWIFGALGKRSWKNPMTQFLIFASIVRIPNGSIFKFRISSKQEINLDEFVISHIPNELQGSFFLDR